MSPFNSLTVWDMVTGTVLKSPCTTLTSGSVQVQFWWINVSYHNWSYITASLHVLSFDWMLDIGNMPCWASALQEIFLNFALEYSYWVIVWPTRVLFLWFSSWVQRSISYRVFSTTEVKSFWVFCLVLCKLWSFPVWMLKRSSVPRPVWQLDSPSLPFQIVLSVVLIIPM